MPVFWIAWLFIWLFNFELGWLPSTYMFTQFPEFEWTAWTAIRDVLHHIALPMISLTFVGWVGAMLIMRPQMNNVVDEGYVFLARAKGLSERTVMIKHAARNALIPVATGAIIGLAFLIDGSVIIEEVFTWPGMGALIVNAVLNRDFPVAQAAFFMLAVLIVVARLVTDVVYTYLDPRIKFGEQQ
jgi:peptide/nickel transport system permease protein